MNKFVSLLKKGQFLYFLGDIILSGLAFYLAIWLRFEGFIRSDYLCNMDFFVIAAAVTIPLLGLFVGSYNGIWKYWSITDSVRQAVCAVGSGLIFAILKYTGLGSMIRPGVHISGSITLIYCCLVFLFTVSLRMLPSIGQWLNAEYSSKKSTRAIIIGAGSTGASLVRRMLEDADGDIHPVAIVDKDSSKKHMRLSGVSVVGDDDDIPEIAHRYHATEAILAVPNMSSGDVNDIYKKCMSAGLKLRIFRDAVDIDSYLVGNSMALKDFSIDDLLFRDSIRPNMSQVFTMLQGKTVLVTGGAGSIGSEICRQVLSHGCRKLIIFDIHENGLFAIDQELKDSFDTDLYELVGGSIRDKQRLDWAFDKYAPDLVLHAAAHKHVPMMEINPAEAVKNNVFGTFNVLKCCKEHKTSRCILISTDKAVRPTNVMGATKRVAELLVKYMNSDDCAMAAVRFGNVLGSNGSVIPIFKRQIANGGPITITHKDIVRYFMTIPEAVSLVLIAGTIAKGGEVFLLDMGKPVKIYDLACDMIRLSGLQPEKDIQIKITGLRPGEKLYEELVQLSEKVDPTVHDKIFIATGSIPENEDFNSNIQSLSDSVAERADDEVLRRLLFKAIDEPLPEECED